MAMTLDRLEALMAMCADQSQRTRDEARQCLRDEFSTMLTEEEAKGVEAWVDLLQYSWGSNLARRHGDRTSEVSKKLSEEFLETHPTATEGFRKIAKRAGRTDESEETKTS